MSCSITNYHTYQRLLLVITVSLLVIEVYYVTQQENSVNDVFPVDYNRISSRGTPGRIQDPAFEGFK